MKYLKMEPIPGLVLYGILHLFVSNPHVSHRPLLKKVQMPYTPNTFSRLMVKMAFFPGFSLASIERSEKEEFPTRSKSLTDYQVTLTTFDHI